MDLISDTSNIIITPIFHRDIHISINNEEIEETNIKYQQTYFSGKLKDVYTKVEGMLELVNEGIFELNILDSNFKYYLEYCKLHDANNTLDSYLVDLKHEKNRVKYEIEKFKLKNYSCDYLLKSKV